MKQQIFEENYHVKWDIFASLLDDLERKKKQTTKDDSKLVCEFPRQYRVICHYLSLAKERGYSIHLVESLNGLVIRGHQQLYKPKKVRTTLIFQFIILDFPSIVRKESAFVGASIAFFLLPALISGLLTYIFPELINSFFSPSQINSFEAMYDPSAEHFGRNRQSDSDFAMFGYYIFNNIGISFQTFAGGIFLGVGSIFFSVL